MTSSTQKSSQIGFNTTIQVVAVALFLLSSEQAWRSLNPGLM